MTGVSLPPDLHAWVTDRAHAASDDPTMKRSASRIVQQALMEYRERIERQEAANLTGKAENTTSPRKADRAGAEIIRLSKNSGTLSSMDGRARSPRAG